MTATPDPEQKVTEEQSALMTLLLEDDDEDVYVVIPIATLSVQLMVAWNEVYRQRHGHVDRGRLEFKLMRILQELGFTRNTKHLKDRARQ